MRHRRRTRRLGRTTPHKKAMMRNMVTSLLKHGRISTTVTRAKELRILADRMITLGKNGSLHARRQALSVIREKAVVARLFNEIAPACMERNGGYTRILKTAPRRGDASMMCIIELVNDPVASAGSEDVTAHSGRVSDDISSAAPSVIPDAAVSADAGVTQEADDAVVSDGDVVETVSDSAQEASAPEAEPADMSGETSEEENVAVSDDAAPEVSEEEKK